MKKGGNVSNQVYFMLESHDVLGIVGQFLSRTQAMHTNSDIKSDSKV